MILRVGITGGIGSGKTTVAAIFETLGIPVYRADEAAKRLMNEDPFLKQELIRSFGEAVYANGMLNRSFLAAKVFSDEPGLALLNSLVHPLTILDAEKWMQQQTTAYAIKEAAIIFETGSQKGLDFIIGVYASPTLRIHRAMKRDHISTEEIKARMARQLDDSIKMKLCDAVINNDGQQALVPQVMHIHQQLINLAAARANS